MSIKLQHQLRAIQQVLAHHPVPHSREEVYGLTAQALHQALGNIRCLFYLADLSPKWEPLNLASCPAQPLAAGLFVYPPATQAVPFTFETPQPVCTALVVAAHTYGCLFVERLSTPLTPSEQQLVSLMATQAAHHLGHLDRLASPASDSQRTPLLTIDRACRLAWIKGTAVPLSDNQLTVLQWLYEHRGQTCSRSSLYQILAYETNVAVEIWQNRLDVLIYRLRQKLQQRGPLPLVIKTVPRVGYRLEVVEFSKF